MKSFKTVTPKSDGGRLQEVRPFTRGSKYTTLTGKLWVFQIDDHYLQEVVPHGCLTLVLSYMNFTLFFALKLFNDDSCLSLLAGYKVSTH